MAAEAYHIDDVLGQHNRVTEAIEKLKLRMADRIKQRLTSKKEVEANRKGLDMNLHEFARFQEIKTLAVSHEKLTEAEGQAVFVLLGNTPQHFNNQCFEVKYVLTKMFAELLQWERSL